ncbi:MAG: cobyrinate a,c-diamide synthase [Clostridia bacterium]|nr:cobyrinate a,c-diamide synthase [Clostridia bacterium]
MRILIAGSASGCGKTTMSMILMAVLRLKGLRVAPCKVGPDYIDTGFHSAVCGRASYNLDTWLMKPESVKSALINDADITVIEGVMGYYDGLDARSLKCSSYEIARLTDTPVLLCVDASGGAASVAATVKGFQTLTNDSRIAGVLVNRVSGEKHYALVREAVSLYTGLPCLGYLNKQQKLELPSRQLGLVPAGETEGLQERVNQAAGRAMETLDLEGILRIAQTAPAVQESDAVNLPDRRGFRLGVARDEAFHFYYQANLDALKKCGMELIFFSPLRDRALPEGLDALYVGGGYPEVFASRLTENKSMRACIKGALEKGIKCYAECGGLMYLGSEIDNQTMVGFLPLKSRMTERLQRFGYVKVEDETGIRFPAHEFHHAEATALAGAAFAYRVTKASQPDKSWDCGYKKGNTLAAFAHTYFADRPELIGRFFG